MVRGWQVALRRRPKRGDSRSALPDFHHPPTAHYERVVQDSLYVEFGQHVVSETDPFRLANTAATTPNEPSSPHLTRVAESRVCDTLLQALEPLPASHAVNARPGGGGSGAALDGAEQPFLASGRRRPESGGYRMIQGGRSESDLA